MLTITILERAMKILHYKSADRMLAVHFGYWNELLDEWADQGKIPRDLARDWADGNEADLELDKLIGWDFNWYCTITPKNTLIPAFEYKVLEELPDGKLRVQNTSSLIERVKAGINSIPSKDNYQLKDSEAFETLYKPRMQFSSDWINLDYFRCFNETRPQNIPVGLCLGSVLGQIRDMTSVAGMSYLIYDDDEELLADNVDTYAEMKYQCAKAVLETGAKFDWEDVCFRNGTLISHTDFEELCAKHYKSAMTSAMNTVSISSPWTATASQTDSNPSGLKTA